ncbi:MAG: hypothetical protein M3680_20970 [Myxococcota bacterium]|nr:hypothetical protein [Myxococcota bacterium]
MVRIALLMLVVTSCWRTSAPEPAPAVASITAGKLAFRARPSSSCARTLDGAVEKLRLELAATGMSETVIGDMRDAAVESCEAMRWSSELLGCYEAAPDTTALAGCQSHMSTEQSEDVSTRMMEVISRMHASSPPAP